MKLLRRFLRGTKASVIVEFALVVPIFFLLIAGVIAFSRGYARLNALNSSLREGARTGATLPAALQTRDAVTARVYATSSAFGFPIDTGQVVVTFGNDVIVSVTSYPIFVGISSLWGMSGITVSRSAVFRWEYAP